MGRLEGDLSVMPLPDLVIWLANRRPSGHLVLEQESIHKEITIRDGQVTCASSNDARERFGQFLIHFGLLTEAQMQRAFQTQKQTDVLLGRILVMIGLVPEEQVIQTLRVKMSESLLDAFRWRYGRFQFEVPPGHDARPAIEVAVPLIDIHREGIARAEMWERFKEAFPDPTQPLEVEWARIPPGLDHDSIEGRIVELATQGLDMESIGLELHATDYQVASRLLELRRLGAIRGARRPSRRADTPLPESGDHLTEARAALQAGRLGDALQHVRDGARLDPGNRAYAALHRDIEAHATVESGDISLRSTIPVRGREPTTNEANRLSARERYILGRVDGERSVQAIIQISPMHDVEALDILRRLATDGFIAFS